jgi:Uma2 family endonuclease
MNAPLLEKVYTAEDLLKLEDGGNLELLDGRLVERPIGAKASVVAANIIALVRPFAHAHGLGLVFDSDCGYQIFAKRDRVRKPDVSFIRHGKLPENKPPDGYVLVAPDLVVEVISPNDLAEEVAAKMMEWLRAGVRLVWVVYPSSRIVQVFRQAGGAANLCEGEQLTGGDVLSEFACDVAEFFVDI